MQTEVLTPIGLDADATNWLLGLVFVFVALGFWSSFGRLRAGGSLGLKAKNLFLTVRAQGDYQVHIITLAPRHMTFVSPRFLAKGEKLRLDVQTLPGFPEGAGPLEVEVTRAHKMRGESDSFVVTAKVQAASPRGESQLVRFLEQLTRPGRLSHA
jgi:hypothetical protein